MAKNLHHIIISVFWFPCYYITCVLRKIQILLIIFFNAGVIQCSAENIKANKFSTFCQKSVLSFKDHHKTKYFLHVNTCNNTGVIIPTIKSSKYFWILSCKCHTQISLAKDSTLHFYIFFSFCTFGNKYQKTVFF